MATKLPKVGSLWVSPDFDDEDLRPCTSKPIRSNRHKKHPSCSKITQKLWLEEDPPIVLDDLAVHKKKLAELKNWLTDSVCGIKGKKFLLLTGPPGSGKSAAIRVLASENNILLREWTNVEKPEKSEEGLWTNQSDLFYSFLSKSSKYNDLFIDCQNSFSRKRLIVIEEFPLFFMKNSVEFHLILRKYNNCSSCPIVFVVTDANDNKSIIRQLFPSEVQDELNITNIAFNSIASSILLQALNRVLRLRSIHSNLASHVQPTKQLLQSIVERSGGDIRSAINTLQFTLTKDSNPSTDVQKFNAKSRPKKGIEKGIDAFDYIGCKDTKLIIFRALGKVLYCKRKNEIEKDHSLPTHLQSNNRFPLEENPEEIFERSATDASTFSLFLHHNCPPFFKQIDSLADALAYFTESDILQSYWNSSNSLEDYCASLSIRGVMHCLSNNMNPSSTGQSFRSLTRPAFFNYRQTANERLRKSKELCRTISCSDAELMTNIIPLMSKVISSNVSDGDRVLKDIGLMFPMEFGSHHTPTKSTKLDLNSSNLQTFSSNHRNADDADEDFIIEDYDD